MESTGVVVGWQPLRAIRVVNLGPAHFSWCTTLTANHFDSVVTFRWEDWRAEIPWMTLYFSVGVWVSIALMRAPLLRERREAAPQ